MGFLSRFEGKMEDTFEGAADRMTNAPISPVQIAKKAEKQMRREKMVGAGKQYAPTLYTVLVNPDDDRRLMGYYPTLAGETETYLAAKASEQGLVMDGQPLVRFIVDEDLKHGKFDIIAEAVAAPIVAQLRNEEMQRYGLAAPNMGGYAAPAPQYGYNQGYDAYDSYDAYNAYNPYDPLPAAAAPVGQRQPLPYVPEEEIDRSLDYGEYTFNSLNFDDSRNESQPYAAPDAETAYAAPATAAETVVFAGGAQTATPVPAQAAVRARLVDVATNRTYDLASARLLVGRESKNDITVHDVNASRTHAELRFEPQGIWTITDLGSTNGTLVNGRMVATQPLQAGDQITIGTTNFIFALA